MRSDYVDNWERLPELLQAGLEPIIARFEEGADLLFDRRLNLSFEAAVKELSIPGVVALTEGMRELQALLTERVTIMDATEGTLIFEKSFPITAYDLPLYTPCVYISQLAQYMDGQNIRVWKESTAQELTGILLTMARYIRPDIEHARTCIAALHDMAYLYPSVLPRLQEAALTTEYTNMASLAAIAAQMAGKAAP